MIGVTSPALHAVPSNIHIVTVAEPVQGYDSYRTDTALSGPLRPLDGGYRPHQSGILAGLDSNFFRNTYRLTNLETSSNY